MDTNTMTNSMEETGLSTNTKIWIGVGIGAAVGLAIALSRRKHDRWESARDITRRISNKSGDFADIGKDIADRVRLIYEESRKLVEDASDLWSRGRKVVGY